jgi:hypothetical protein
MIKSVKSVVLTAVLLAAMAGSAYAAGETTYSAPNYGQKASGGSHTQTTHFQKPPGYDENPAMNPYTRNGFLKAN